MYTKHDNAMPPTRLVLFVFMHRAMIAVICVAMLFNVSFALMSVQRVLPTLWIESSYREAISTIIGKNIKKKEKESQKSSGVLLSLQHYKTRVRQNAVKKGYISL